MIRTDQSAELLVIFDIDGTLVQSVHADSQCYDRALREALNLENGDQWSSCRHSTDPGILVELFYLGYDRHPTDAEIARFQECFFNLLETRCARESIIPTSGANAMLEALVADPSVSVAYGTGAWRRSAELKMSSAGLPLATLPGATGDDAVSREAIIQTAIARAVDWYRVTAFERLVYVGDGVWDARACAKLGVPFVGVGKTAGVASMRRAGAEHFVRDFTDQAAFHQMLRAARAPRPPPAGRQAKAMR